MVVCDFGCFGEGFNKGEVWEEQFSVDDAVHLVDGFGKLGDFATKFFQLRFATARVADADCSGWLLVPDGPQSAAARSRMVVGVRVGHWWRGFGAVTESTKIVSCLFCVDGCVFVTYTMVAVEFGLFMWKTN